MWSLSMCPISRACTTHSRSEAIVVASWAQPRSSCASTGLTASKLKATTMNTNSQRFSVVSSRGKYILLKDLIGHWINFTR